MLGTRRRSFGNIVGHVKGVGDLSSLSAWTAEQFDPRLTWADVEWIKERWGGKLILKGILDVEDARLAADSGADALIVSNHGGRQLDGAPSSIRALPAIAEAVGSRIEVWMDGGIRSGQDVLKAVALGAKGTLIGRAFLYGLGAMGEAGVTKCARDHHEAGAVRESRSVATSMARAAGRKARLGHGAHPLDRRLRSVSRRRFSSMPAGPRRHACCCSSCPAPTVPRCESACTAPESCAATGRSR